MPQADEYWRAANGHVLHLQVLVELSTTSVSLSGEVVRCPNRLPAGRCTSHPLGLWAVKFTRAGYAAGQNGGWSRIETRPAPAPTYTVEQSVQWGVVRPMRTVQALDERQARRWVSDSVDHVKLARRTVVIGRTAWQEVVDD